ncbi:YihY/virulence factor BrkB family protein [Planktothrix sp. FACHB-1365]|uniref:YihY/virulence factor BrkB family protein n=1 Tax=Planktothrix sp. FACHB-1365 TaxID=2692855 RepID=UPI001F5487CE|nr:YihY/virulence factor BrkB family protein [Planktothrix sp. FACHB-1365]
MVMASFFRFWRHLKWVKWEPCSVHTHLVKLIADSADCVADLLIALFPILIKGLKRIHRRMMRFCCFFLYLNRRTFKQLIQASLEQRLPGFAAEMAYHATLALFPAVLALLIAISSFQLVQTELYQMAILLSQIVPEEVQDLIGNGIKQLSLTPSSSLLSFSFLVSLWIFSGVIGAAMDALNHIHRVKKDHLRPFWKNKLIALALALGTLLLLISASALVLISDFIVEGMARQSCMLETVGNCALEDLAICMTKPPVQSCLLESTLLETWKQFRWPITLGIVSTNYAFIYRYAPSYREPGTPLMPGAILAAVFWAFVSNLFRWYVYHFGNFNITYGTIGGFVVLLLWLQISSLIMLIGAQLNVIVGDAMNTNS